jgi:hypothetical protein
MWVKEDSIIIPIFISITIININLISFLLSLKLLLFAFKPGTTKNYLRSMPAVQVKIVLQDALQQLMFVGTLTYLEPTLFLLTTFHTCTS